MVLLVVMNFFLAEVSISMIRFLETALDVDECQDKQVNRKS